MQLPLKLPLELMQNRWASILNPLLAIPILNGQVLSVSLVSGDNVINHKLSRIPQGFFVVDLDSNVTIYRSKPLNNLTLTLAASGTAQVKIYVF